MHDKYIFYLRPHRKNIKFSIINTLVDIKKRTVRLKKKKC